MFRMAVAALPQAKKGRVQDFNACLLRPGLGGEIGAGGYSPRQAQPGQHPGARTLGRDQSSRRVLNRCRLTQVSRPSALLFHTDALH
jgi:hypothetical protein